MKRILLTILVSVLSLSLAGVATAAPPKPPKSLCINTCCSGGGVFALVVKPSASIKMLNGTQKFYSIQGANIADINMPVVGAGYMEGNTFHFTLNSTYNSSGTPYFIQEEGFWDVISKTGTMYAHFSAGANYTYSLSEASCTDQDILYRQEDEGSPLATPDEYPSE